jgi:DNA-binding transcriptional regulator YiaG
MNSCQPVSNIASVLKEEISQVVSKEIRRETSFRNKASSTHHSEIAALKRRVEELERQLRRASRGAEPAVPAAGNKDAASARTRFSARSMASQRKRLGLSAAECGLLIGASAQSIFKWEEGNARPGAQEGPEARQSLRTACTGGPA